MLSAKKKRSQSSNKNKRQLMWHCRFNGDSGWACCILGFQQLDKCSASSIWTKLQLGVKLLFLWDSVANMSRRSRNSDSWESVWAGLHWDADAGALVLSTEAEEWSYDRLEVRVQLEVIWSVKCLLTQCNPSLHFFQIQMCRYNGITTNY